MKTICVAQPWPPESPLILEISDQVFEDRNIAMISAHQHEVVEIKAMESLANIPRDVI